MSKNQKKYVTWNQENYVIWNQEHELNTCKTKQFEIGKSLTIDIWGFYQENLIYGITKVEVKLFDNNKFDNNTFHNNTFGNNTTNAWITTSAWSGIDTLANCNKVEHDKI